MAARPERRILPMVVSAILGIAAILPGSAAQACGWGGDGEMSREDIAGFPTFDGEPLPETLSLATAWLPNRMGFGIAVPEPGRAIPYLQATYGRRPNAIGEFKAYGFRAVIDIGTPTAKAARHRIEAELAGMSYFNIPVAGEMPSIPETQHFTRLVLQTADDSLLVYSLSPQLLGVMWASHRINLGSPVSFAIAEARLLGLTEEQEALLRRRAGAGTN